MQFINDMIESISDAPNRAQREEIYEQSKKGQKQSEEYTDINSPKDLFTKNKQSKDTGYKTTIFNKKELAVYFDKDYSIFNTQSPQLSGGSMGSNICPVIPVCINLFHKDEKTTRASLGKFMNWRKTNWRKILEAYVSCLEQFEKPEKKETLEKSLQSRGREYLEANVEDYRNTARLFRMKLDSLEENADPAEKGFRIISFCQTWFKKGKVGKACFSVPSPHFQTFSYLDISMCSDASEEMLESYTHLLRLQEYDMTTKIVDGVLEYEKSFVNLDKMWKNMNEKNMFFVNCAPSFDTFPLIVEARESVEDGKFFLVFSSSLSDYMFAYLVDSSSPDEFRTKMLPSNFRAPINPTAKINGLRCTTENYSQIQENISTSLAAIFSWCKREEIDVYFASAPRDSRPLYIKSPNSNLTKSNNQNFDKQITIRVVDELLKPALSSKFSKSDLFELVVDSLDKYTEHKASFLADVATVAVAAELLDNPECWLSYNLKEEPVVKKVGVGSYVCAKFIRTQIEGSFKSLSLEGQRRAGGAVKNSLECTEPIWKSCSIMHDAFLNDIDDPAANELARRITSRGGFYLYQNYV
jgi:hypothetical protein